MPETHSVTGLIGPNALTQLLPLLDRAGGAGWRDALLARAGITELPDMTGLIPEAPVARLHQALRADRPDLAPDLGREAGARTADYILAQRIPNLAQILLKALPAPLAAPLLTKAITKHAWTFAGSGRFSVVCNRPLTVSILDNPVVRGEHSDIPLCHWHAAVFERLYRALVDDRLRADETTCCAQGAPACTFRIARP